jgi:acyl carrier protein
MADTTVDGELRQRVVDTMCDLIVRMLRLQTPVTADTDVDELAMSSSQSAQLILDIESDLSIMVDVEDLDADEMCTVGELADYIVSHSTPQ